MLWRMLRRSPLLIALLLALPHARAEQSVEGALERLASGSALERELAQRWLATHLATDDFSAVAGAAQRGDAEVERRLSEALAADDRHLGLVMLLASERAEGLQRLGRRVFAQLVLRWCPGAEGNTATRAAVTQLLARRDVERYASAAAEEPLARVLDRLARLSDLAVPLVIAPELAGREPFARPALEGPATQLLVELARIDRCSFAGVGGFQGEEPGAGAFVVVSTLSSVHRGGGLEWLRSWCEDIQAARGPDFHAAASARALGATGWPAGIRWLEERWLARRDANALAGLLSAAERGLVAPGLTRPGERRRVLAYADLALDTPGGERAAERAARGLAALGAASSSGEDPGLELIEGFGALGPRARWVRLVALEGVRSAHPRVVELLERVLGDPAGEDPSLQLQAARALALAPPAPGRVPGRAAALFEHARAEGGLEELAALLAALSQEGVGALEGAGFASPGAELGQRLFLLDVAQRARHPRLAELVRAELGRASGAEEQAAALLLTTWVRRDGPAAVWRLLQDAGPGAESLDRPSSARLAALAGCLPADLQVPLLERLERAERRSTAELELLGALAAGPRGARAREILLAELEGAERADESLVRALERGLDELRRARLDLELAEFLASIRSTLSQVSHPLRQRMRGPTWPPSHAAPASPLELLDRRLPGALRG